jgi:catechol 2,3-dioxygenase-like lactoylglutathione lyase family enzyme
MPARWTHVVLKVSDLDRSIAFYRRHCALEVVRDGRPAGHTVWLAAGAPAGAPPPFVLVLYLTAVDFRLDHLGFQCASRAEVDAVAAEGARLGILAEPPFDGGGDIGYVTMLRDPDGHRVEFTWGQPIAGLGP